MTTQILDPTHLSISSRDEKVSHASKMIFIVFEIALKYKALQTGLPSPQMEQAQAHQVEARLTEK
jgi:hypothetical protein